jgi:hypothetical protein
MTPDNPYAVAFAFWHAALNENYDDLELVITPESRGQWDLADIRARTEDSGIATGVYKPRYDVAYVKLLSSVGDKEEPIQVLRNPLPAEARIISLVYRPELGGWRVHGSVILWTLPTCPAPGRRDRCHVAGGPRFTPSFRRSRIDATCEKAG